MQSCRARSAGTAVTAATAGYTLVELVIVIAVIGLLAVVAAPRFFDRDTFAERAWFDEIATAMRYSRSVAVASGCSVRLQLTPTTYELRQQAPSGGHCNPGDSSWSQAVRYNDGTVAMASAPAGASSSVTATIVFTPAGSTNLASDLGVTVGVHALTLRASSGYLSQ
ncbi:MAG: GspH/FimT family pseudopilin [Gammaproteobacteria bacterium]|nr:GspH/FimT family pseudopilin [Gammaproteobacteria bacterium]NND60014.1 prepilin-type N-terminal cleavage/methylation domain-containing protein [Gammaproteobacteria bacterium]